MNINNFIVTCRDCKDRYTKVVDGKAVSCHAECELYIEYVAELKRVSDIRKKEQQNNSYAFKDYDEIKKIKKFKNKM